MNEFNMNDYINYCLLTESRPNLMEYALMRNTSLGEVEPDLSQSTPTTGIRPEQVWLDHMLVNVDALPPITTEEEAFIASLPHLTGDYSKAAQDADKARTKWELYEPSAPANRTLEVTDEFDF